MASSSARGRNTLERQLIAALGRSRAPAGGAPPGVNGGRAGEELSGAASLVGTCSSLRAEKGGIRWQTKQHARRLKPG
jgi:hypothetical protein